MEITLQKVVLHIFFCREVKTDIFQNGGGGHLGFMHQRDLKKKLNLINEFIVLITLWKVVLDIFSATSEEMIFFKNCDGGHFGFMHQRNLKIKIICQKWVCRTNYTLKSGITHLFRTNYKKNWNFNKKGYIFKNVHGGHLGFMYERDLKIRK